MNTKLFTHVALAAALLIGGPAFAGDDHRAGGGHAVAHRTVAAGHRAVALQRATRARTVIASRRTFSTRTPRALASTRHSTTATRAYATNTRAVRSTRAVAFGGNSNAQNNANNRGHYQYAFASHSGWNQNREYFWQGHHYRWYRNAWFIIDPFPYYPAYGYYPAGGPVGVEVQEALTQQGYYQGPIDGIIGPGTRAAIAAYQQANGLRVTGTITNSLLNNLGVS
jgi:hypothetical protein